MPCGTGGTLPDRTSPDREWNLTRLTKDAEKGGETVRQITAYNLWYCAGEINDSVPLLALLLEDAAVSIRRAAAEGLLCLGRNLLPADLHALLPKIVAESRDLATSTLFLGYCFVRQHQETELRLLRRRIIIWLILRHPGCETLSYTEASFYSTLDAESYAEAKALWHEHLRYKPVNPAIVRNAITFLRVHDPELSESLKRLLGQQDN